MQTDAGVIEPASYCGVFAAKPSHGIVSRAGVLPVSRTLDQVGVFARTLDDIALALDVIAGHDPADPDTRPVAAPAFAATLNERPPLPPQFAFVRTPHWQTLGGDAREAFEQLIARLGPAAQPVDLPDRFRETGALHRAIWAADLAHSLDLPARQGGEGLGSKLKAVVAEGRKVEAVRYLAALKQARAFGAGLAEVFTMYDAIITPASAGVAPIGDEATADTAFCTLWTLVGLPSLLLPILQGEDGMPLGVQVIGQAGDDARLLRSARSLLETLGGRRPAARPRRSRATKPVRPRAERVPAAERRRRSRMPTASGRSRPGRQAIAQAR